MKQRKPKQVRAVWGIWVPDYHGCLGGNMWLQHVVGPEDGPEAYTSKRAAQRAATYWQADFPTCYAALLCGKAGKP